jgi:phosphoglycerate kinase
VIKKSEIELARGLVEQDAIDRKIIEPPFLVESDTLVGRKEGQFRVIAAKVLL